MRLPEAHIFHHPWFWWGLAVLALAWVVSLILVRLWTRHRLLKTLAPEAKTAGELDISIHDPRPEDEAALEVIQAHRRQVLLNPWPETQLGFTAISQLSQAVVREIAQIYYPGEARPEFKASLADLVALQNRVGARLRAWLDTMPLRAIKDMELETVLWAHELYQTVKAHPVSVFLRRHHLDKAAKWTWGLVNFTNPWYWGRRAVYTGGREALGRLFLAKVVTLVGEEALLLYGRRSPRHEDLGHYLLAIQEMINVGLADGGGQLPPQTARHILHFILEARNLEDPEKLALARRLARPRRQKPVDPETLAETDRQRMHRWLKEMVRASFTGEERERRLAEIKARWGQ